MQSSSIEVLRTLISHVSLPARSQLLSSSAAEPIVSTLLHALNVEDSMMQVQLLGLLRFIVLEAHNGSSEVPALFSSSSFSSTILLGIQKAHEDFHKEHMGNSINLTQETLSLLSHWIWFTISILPVLQGALANVAISTITVICQEIRHIPPGKMYNSAHPLLLNGLRGVIHHCLFADEALSTSAMSESSENTASQSSVGRMFAPAQTISGLLFGGIFGGKSTTERSSIKKERLPIREAHTASLEMLPILVEACLFAWESFSSCIKNADDTSQLRTRASLFDLRSSRSQSLYRNGSLGISYTPRKESLSFTPSSALSLNHHVKKVKKEILHLLTPIAHNFPQPFMRAFLHSWEKSMSTTGSKLLPSHSVALELLNMLKTASPSVVIGSLVPIAMYASLIYYTNHFASNLTFFFFSSSVMDNSDRMSHTSSENLRDSEPYLSALKIHETAALHLIDAYMKQCSFADQLHEALPHVLDLIKQSLLRSNHPLTFIWLLGILQQYVRRHTSVKLDKKSQKELQDITQQLLQTCAMFAGRVCEVFDFI